VAESTVPRLTHFVVQSKVTLSKGPRLPPGVDHVELIGRPHLKISYHRYQGPPIVEQTYVGAQATGGRRIDTPGILQLWSRLAWQPPRDGATINAEHRTVQLAEPALSMRDLRVADLTRAAIAAFDMASDAYTEVWRADTSAHWEAADGTVYRILSGRAMIEMMPAAVLGDAEQQRFEPLLELMSHAKSARLRAAYSVAHLNTEHFAPATRVVFGWALIERLCKRFKPGKQLSHHDVLKLALRHCQAAVATKARPPVEWARLQHALKRAYHLRNGLAHGEPEAISDMDLPALAHAATLLARALAARRNSFRR
jgi:hypothetical protein